MPKEAKAKRERKAPDEAKAKKAAAKDKGPKRPLSAFMYFCKDWRDRVKTENPEASFGEVGKLLGIKWKELEEDEKKNYLEEAAADKARYEKEKGVAPAAPPKKKKAAKAETPDDDDDDDE